MDSSGKCWQVIFAKQTPDNEAFGNFLENYFDVVSCDYTEDGFDIWSGYKNSKFNKDEFLEHVIEFAPVDTEKFLIYGIHEKQTPTTDKLAIRIYAATAFGSEHQTTRSCLQGICDIDNMKLPHQNILDVGCGSGILSLACAKLWKDCKITAVDIDDEAVIVTNQNAQDNQLSEQINCFWSDGYKNPQVQKNAPYDIILANILARPLIEMAPSLTNSLKIGGKAIISGFVEDQAEWVIKAHTDEGLKHIKTYSFDNWRAALLEKTA